MICDNSDFMLIQEHWNLPTQLNKGPSCVNEFKSIVNSGVGATARILYGCPFRGCAILWKKCISVCDHIRQHGIVISGDINCDFNNDTGFVTVFNGPATS